MQKIMISDDMSVIVKDIRKSKRLWGNILFAAITSLILILCILAYTKNLVSIWSLLLCIPLGPIFVAWLCFSDDSEGLRSFESKYLLENNVGQSSGF